MGILRMCIVARFFPTFLTTSWFIVSAFASNCFKENASWNETTPVNFHFPVLSSSECQKICQDELPCTAWTWTNEENDEITNFCYSYSAIGSSITFDNAISGPRSCLCSQQYACSASEDNIIRMVAGIQEEEECQSLCKKEDNCNIYTWYDTSEALANLCLLLSDCRDQVTECTGCFSGPPTCNTGI